MLTLHRSTHCAKQILLLQPQLQNWDTRRKKDRVCNLDISLCSSMSSTAKVLQLNGFGFPFATCPNVCGAVRPIHTTYQHYPDIEDTWRCFQFCMRYVRFDVLFRQSEENYRSCKVTGKSHWHPVAGPITNDNCIWPLLSLLCGLHWISFLFLAILFFFFSWVSIRRIVGR